MLRSQKNFNTRHENINLRSIAELLFAEQSDQGYVLYWILVRGLSNSFCESLRKVEGSNTEIKERIEMLWVCASPSNYECNLRWVKAACDCLSTCSHALMRQTNKTLQTESPSDLFINSRKKLRATDFHCDQLLRRDISFLSRSTIAYAEHVWILRFWFLARHANAFIRTRIYSSLAHQCV